MSEAGIPIGRVDGAGIREQLTLKDLEGCEIGLTFNTRQFRVWEVERSLGGFRLRHVLGWRVGWITLV